MHCTHAYKHTLENPRAYVCMHKHTHAHTSLCTGAPACRRMQKTHLNTHARTHAHTQTYTHTYIHVHKCTCMHTRMQKKRLKTHKHTHTHTRARKTHTLQPHYSHACTHPHTHTHAQCYKPTQYIGFPKGQPCGVTATWNDSGKTRSKVKHQQSFMTDASSPPASVPLRIDRTSV